MDIYRSSTALLCASYNIISQDLIPIFSNEIISIFFFCAKTLTFQRICDWNRWIYVSDLQEHKWIRRDSIPVSDSNPRLNPTCTLCNERV